MHWQNASLLPPLLAMAAALILIFTKVTVLSFVDFDFSRTSGGDGGYNFAKERNISFSKESPVSKLRDPEDAKLILLWYRGDVKRCFTAFFEL